MLVRADVAEYARGPRFASLNRRRCCFRHLVFPGSSRRRASAAWDFETAEPGPPGRRRSPRHRPAARPLRDRLPRARRIPPRPRPGPPAAHWMHAAGYDPGHPIAEHRAAVITPSAGARTDPPAHPHRPDPRRHHQRRHQRRDVGDVGVGQVDAHTEDVGGSPPDPDDRMAARRSPSAGRGVVADRALSHARVDRTRLGRSQGDRAYRGPVKELVGQDSARYNPPRSCPDTDAGRADGEGGPFRRA